MNIMLRFQTTESTLDMTEGISSPGITIQPLVPPGVLCFNSFNFVNTPLGVVELLYQFLTGGTGKLHLDNSNYCF